VQGETVAKIMSRFAVLPGVSELNGKMAEWIGRISDYLADIKDSDPFDRAATALGIPADDIKNVMAPVGGRWFIATQMLGSGLSGTLRPAVAELAYKLSEDPLRRLIYEVKPAWIDPGAARLLLPPASGPDHMMILLNAALPETAEQYVERAICCAMEGYRYRSVGTMPVGEEGWLGLSTCYAETLYDLFAIPSSWELVEPSETGMRYFLIVKAEAANVANVVAAVRDMQTRYPRLIVIMLTGSDGLDDGIIDGLGLNECIFLEPMLASGAELVGYQLRCHLDSLFDRATGRRGGN
jgi:hypothetical protein